MRRQEFCRLRVELDFFIHTDVDFGEIALIEVGLQHFSALKDVLFFEFALRAEDKPRRVELFILVANGLFLLRVVRLQAGNAGVEVVDGFVELRDMNIFGIQFFPQLLQLLVFFVQLFHQSVHRFPELIATRGSPPCVAQ